jgi:carbonic anhydrase/acetyltransferase-like protein (isoleucine patch superfamily)
MSLAVANRTLGWDWYGGTIPENVVLDEEAYLETTYSFLHYRSQVAEGVRLGEGSTVYMGTMFDVGPGGRVSLGRCALVHGAWIICDAQVEIGDYALISWNVVLMDTYRACREPRRRRFQLRQVPAHPLRRLLAETEAQPIRIGRNAWIGFDCCVLPGITIGEGSIVGARSVVTENVPPYTVVAGNPARVIRPIHNDENAQTN